MLQCTYTRHGVYWHHIVCSALHFECQHRSAGIYRHHYSYSWFFCDASTHNWPHIKICLITWNIKNGAFYHDGEKCFKCLLIKMIFKTDNMSQRNWDILFILNIEISNEKYNSVYTSVNDSNTEAMTSAYRHAPLNTHNQVQDSVKIYCIHTQTHVTLYVRIIGKTF